MHNPYKHKTPTWRAYRDGYYDRLENRGHNDQHCTTAAEEAAYNKGWREAARAVGMGG